MKGTSWKIFNGLVRFALTTTWYRQSEFRHCITISLEPDVAAVVCLRRGSRDAKHFAKVDFHELWDAERLL
jgi:DNA polymerase II small subunit/DNA polymerase delta subunit B